MSEKKKKIIISTCLILVLILAVVGISYAAFQFVGQGDKVNQITTGTISMNYEEGTNVIRLTNALPTTDATGMKRLTDGEYFDFSVTTNITGDAVINWEIAADDFEDNTFDGSNVKFYLTKLVDGNELEVSSSLPAVYSENTAENKKTGRPANMMSLLTGSTSTQGEEITNYRLRLYVDENYNPQGDGGGLIFKTRINVYGKVSTEKELPIMRDLSGEVWSAGGERPARVNDDFGNDTYESLITSIVTKRDTMIPDTALEVENGKGNYWDESEAGDNSVVAYIEEKIGETVIISVYDSDLGKYVDKEVTVFQVTIGGQGGIKANANSTFAFGEFSSLKTMDLSCLDTSSVTKMEGMFAYCPNLVSLNLSSFDTSKVINMESLFFDCKKLANLNLNNFNTHEVTSMSYMFCYCYNLTSLDLSSFDTSKVISMQSMFSDCSNLTNITVSSLWKVENVDIYDMFGNCGTDHVTVV